MSTEVLVDTRWFICLLLTATIQIEFKYCKQKSFRGVLGTVIQLQSSRGKCCIAALLLFHSKSLLACNMQRRSFNTSRLFSASLCRSAVSIIHIIKTSLTSFGDGGERKGGMGAGQGGVGRSDSLHTDFPWYYCSSVSQSAVFLPLYRSNRFWHPRCLISTIAYHWDLVLDFVVVFWVSLKGVFCNALTSRQPLLNWALWFMAGCWHQGKWRPSK